MVEKAVEFLADLANWGLSRYCWTNILIVSDYSFVSETMASYAVE